MIRTGRQREDLQNHGTRLCQLQISKTSVPLAMNEASTWRWEDVQKIFLKLTLEYCLRRLKRCTILTEGRTHSWKPYSTPGHSYILPKYKQPYIVNCTFTSTHTHTEGTQATLLFKHPHALTLLVHIAFVHYALCKHKWREGKRKKQGGLKKNKKGGGARRDRDSPAVLPKTHIPRDP